MNYINRNIAPVLFHYLAQDRSVLLLGPRQTGKTTLIQQISADMTVSFIKPRVRLKYERDPSLLSDEIEALAEQSQTIPLVVVDEVQKIPLILDVVQDLIDRKIAKFILTGSSARKLRRGHNINLLPGRLIVLYLDPFLYSELSDKNIPLEQLLTDGALPGILLTQDPTEREDLLTSYVITYLEEEIRAEALVRNLSTFSKFLTLAATESGKPVNYTKLSQDIGVAHSTIASYYEILEDCLIAQCIMPYTRSTTRKKLSKTKKYLFFDMGVRRVAAREGSSLPLEYMGYLFEQFVALELLRQFRSTQKRTSLYYWRDPDGPEVDWVLEKEHTLIPIEVKWTTRPTEHDARHLTLFLNEYPQASCGYIICRADRKIKLTDRIYAVPWQNIDTLA